MLRLGIVVWEFLARRNERNFRRTKSRPRSSEPEPRNGKEVGAACTGQRGKDDEVTAMVAVGMGEGMLLRKNGG